MEIINEDYLMKKSYESEMIRNVIKDNFLSVLMELNFDVNLLLIPRKMKWQKIDEFNNCLRQIKEIIQINIYEMLLFLEDDYITVEFAINLLDERNKSIIREEMIQDYHIDHGGNRLSDVFCWDGIVEFEEEKIMESKNKFKKEKMVVCEGVMCFD